MCNIQCIDFVKNNLTESEVKGKRVLEVGSFNVNGSVREDILKLNPSEYIGVDIKDGPCVDEICTVYGLMSRFGMRSFDIIITTEMMEHIEYWYFALLNIHYTLKEDGLLLLTTRNSKSGKHDFPSDHWRYEILDMVDIFQNYYFYILMNDPSGDGTFMKVKRLANSDLKRIKLLNINTGVREL